MKIFKMIRGFFVKRSRSYKIMQNVIFHVKLLSLTLRLLTHVKVSVRCLFKDDQFSLLVWLLLSLLFLCFHIQKQLILHALAINPSVLIELHLGISNMHHLIVGQVGIKIITSITGGEESNPL